MSVSNFASEPSREIKAAILDSAEDFNFIKSSEHIRGNQVSVDRLDNSRGYSRDNIIFCSDDNDACIYLFNLF